MPYIFGAFFLRKLMATKGFVFFRARAGHLALDYLWKLPQDRTVPVGDSHQIFGLYF